MSVHHRGSRWSPDTGHSLGTHLVPSLLEAVEPVAEVAPGPGACSGLSWELWAEEGV